MGDNGVIKGEKPLLKSNGAKHQFEEIPQQKLSQNSMYAMVSLFLSVASVMLSTGMAVGALNPALNILAGFFNETHMDRYNESLSKDQGRLLISLSVSMLLAGGFVGALSIELVLRLFSRKNSMIVMNLTNVLAVLIMTIGGWFGPSYEAIIIGRFIMGLFSGFGMNLIPIVVTECCAPPRHAFYLSLIGVDLSLGGLIGLIFGYDFILGTAELWPALLSISAFPSLLYLFLSPWLPESPSYLIRLGKKRLAKQMLWKLRANVTEDDISHEINGIQSYQQLNGDVKQISLVTMFKSRHYRRQLFVVVMVFLQAQLCGINAIGMYSNKIFEEASFLGQAATIASTIVYAVQFKFACFGSFFVDRYGPKPVNIISGSVMSVSLALLTAAMATKDDISSMRYVSVAAVTICVVAWACGINVALFPMLSAFTTETTRETAFFFGGGIFWIFSWFVSFIPPYLLNWLGNFAFLPFSITNAIFAVYVAIFLPNTHKKSMSEIQAYIQNGNHIFKKNGFVNGHA